MQTRSDNASIQNSTCIYIDVHGICLCAGVESRLCGCESNAMSTYSLAHAWHNPEVACSPNRSPQAIGTYAHAFFRCSSDFLRGCSAELCCSSGASTRNRRHRRRCRRFEAHRYETVPNKNAHRDQCCTKFGVSCAAATAATAAGGGVSGRVALELVALTVEGFAKFLAKQNYTQTAINLKFSNFM